MNVVSTTPTTPVRGPIRVAANNDVTKRLGNWTDARDFEVRAHHGVAVLDLRSPHIPSGEITVRVDLDRSVLKLLLPDDAVLDDWDLRRVGRGRIKDAGPGRTPADAGRPEPAGGRRVVLRGELRNAEIRAHRSGVAILSAMFSREYLVDLRRAHKQGGFPTVDDPTRTA